MFQITVINSVTFKWEHIVTKEDDEIIRIRNFYDKYFMRHREFYERERHAAWVKWLLPLKRPARLLDVACGNCYFLSQLLQYPDLELTGTDISATALAIGKEILGPRIHLVCTATENLPFESGYFDYITCIGSLEHFSNLPRALREMVRVGKPDALYFIQVPNASLNYKTLMKGTSHTFQVDVKEELYTKEEWVKILQDSGVRVTNIFKDDAFKPGFTSLKRFILKIMPLKFCPHFIILGRKERP